MLNFYVGIGVFIGIVGINMLFDAWEAREKRLRQIPWVDAKVDGSIVTYSMPERDFARLDMDARTIDGPLVITRRYWREEPSPAPAHPPAPPAPPATEP